MVAVRFHNEFGEKGVRALARGLRTFYFARKDEEDACVGVLVGKTRRLDLHSTLYGDFTNSGSVQEIDAIDIQNPSSGSKRQQLQVVENNGTQSFEPANTK